MDKYVVRLAIDLTVNEAQLTEFKSIAAAMTAGSQSEPGTLGYEWFFSGDQKRCRLLETYLNADAVLAHFTGTVVQEMVPKLTAVCSIDSFEIFGDPGSKVTEMAAQMGAKIFPYWLGLNR